MNIRKIILVIALISICMLLLSQVSKYRISQKQCIGCGLCVQSKVCPTQAIIMKNGKAEINTEKCIGCGLCKNGLNSYKGCPVNAISAELVTPSGNSVVTEQKNKPVTETPVTEKKTEKNVKTTIPVTDTKTVAKVDSVKTTEEENVVKKVIYFVQSKVCIGCKLCISQCPVNAISFVKGKAIIDTEKCISCGLCKNGNPSTNYKGCPVSAISTKTSGE